MVNKKMTMRDYYRGFITKANKEAGVTFNAAKLSSKDECEEYLLNLIKNLRHKKQDNKAYIKEIDSLKEEIEILSTGNKKLEDERAFYITQANEARERALLEANLWKDDYFKEKDKHNSTKARLQDYMVIVFGLGVISIVMLIWK